MGWGKGREGEGGDEWKTRAEGRLTDKVLAKLRTGDFRGHMKVIMECVIANA